MSQSKKKLSSLLLPVNFALIALLAVAPSTAYTRPSICEAAFSSDVFADSTKPTNWDQLSRREKLKLRRKNMFSRDPDLSQPVEKRIKVLVTGFRKDAVSTMDPADRKIDFADPSLSMPITYPNGVTKYRINASGLRYIEADRVEDFFRGGVFKVQRSRGFYPDGTEMKGAYHNEAWSWDVVSYKNEVGDWIALGGTMQQQEPGVLPQVALHNYSRSRWYGLVKHVETRPGVFEEQIHWQAPVHDFNQSKAVDWTYHGYGGTLLTQWNPRTRLHEPVKLANGNYLLFYERVSEQRRLPDGRLVPYVTTMFSREMDPTLTKTVGEEVAASQIKSEKTGQYFNAAKRGLPHEDEGYLLEGGNVFINNDGQFLKAFSGNDYVRRYGIYLDYLPKGADPRSTFKPVVDEYGELIDFADKMNLREIMHGTWVGRPQIERAPDGQVWMKFHFVPLESIPKGAPVEGWPTAEQFVQYGRITAMVPIKITADQKGQPQLELDLDEKFRYLYE